MECSDGSVETTANNGQLAALRLSNFAYSRKSTARRIIEALLEVGAHPLERNFRKKECPNVDETRSSSFRSLAAVTATAAKSIPALAQIGVSPSEARAIVRNLTWINAVAVNNTDGATGVSFLSHRFRN